MLDKRCNLRGKVVTRRRLFISKRIHPVTSEHKYIHQRGNERRKKQRIISHEKISAATFSFHLCIFHSFILPLFPNEVNKFLNFHKKRSEPFVRSFALFILDIFVNGFRRNFPCAHRLDNGCRARSRVTAAINAFNGSFTNFVHRNLSTTKRF